MNARGWLVREELIRVVREAPAPPATWFSVARRTVVVLAFFVGGLATGHLQLAALACFGALQVGLLEVVLPFRRLLVLMAAMVACCTVSVYAAMVVGGTWWMVILVGALAYAFGCTASLGQAFSTVGIAVLALAVIFSGMPQVPSVALEDAAWVGLGALAQCAAALIVWAPERTRFVRRALAIKIGSDARLLASPLIDPSELLATHAASDAMADALNQAQLPADDDMRIRQAFSRAVVATRALVAWLTLSEPAAEDRLSATLALEHGARSLVRLHVPAADSARVVGTKLTPSAGRPAELALASIGDLNGAIDTVRSGGPAATSALHLLARPRPARPRVGLRAFLSSFLPAGHLSRNGLRMAVGLLVAETISLLIPVNHSFWLPLTVVFTLKPDWTFTVIRGLNRTLGNLLAVIAVPAVLLASGASDLVIVGALAALLAITYRWFFGNYAIASFGLAGSVLVLDYAINPGENLFLIRIAAAIAGALLSLVVAFAIPTWRSDDAPAIVDRLAVALDRLWRGVEQGADETDLDAGIIEARSAMQQMQPVATGALLEPKAGAAPIRLAMAREAGIHLLTHLLAHAYMRLADPGARSQAPDDAYLDPRRLGQARREWQYALERYRDVVSAATG